MTIQLSWPTDYRVITQRFGANPQNYTRYGLPGHEGVDIRAPHGSNIYACADGEVYQVTGVDNNPYGIHLRLRHADGYKTIYAHLKQPLVVVGQQVKRGELIAVADNTGNSSGSHLHLTLKKDGATAAGLTRYPFDILDPTPYLVYDTQGMAILKTTATLGLRVRSGPGFTFPVIGSIPPGTTVKGYPKGQPWTQVELNNGVRGWSFSQYLQLV